MTVKVNDETIYKIAKTRIVYHRCLRFIFDENDIDFFH